MYTLNSYTVNFFKQHFESEIEPLLKNPNRPQKVTFNIRENPLNYRHKLKCYSLIEKNQCFFHFHPSPPLLMNTDAVENIELQSYPNLEDIAVADKWKLMFMCSVFGSVSQKE